MEIKLTEDQKHKICDLIEKSLNNVRLQNYKTDDDDNLPLVDLLSTGETILEGQEEIENIVEQIFFDMDNWAIQLKPVEIPEISDEMLELDNPWNTMDVITKLIWATEYLLHNKSYDGHNYEELNICVTRGKEILHYMKEWYREEQRKRMTK